METRYRRHVCEKASAVPPEVWQLIVSFLAPSEAVRAALVCSEFAAISTPATQQSCRRLWPQHSKRLAVCCSPGVQRFLRLVQAHEDEVAAHPDVSKAKSVQRTVCPEHRQIAVEWLIEVSWDWQLESTVVYRGTQYLDHYLATHPVPALSKFQMLAISCLRTALKHSSKLAERERARLPCKHWAEVTDGACTEAEVRNTCLKLERMLQPAQRSHPNAKQRLRYLWYRLYDAGTVKQEHVYIYMLASFLLHLSLLDSTLSAVTPTKLATAALSLALKVFDFPPMPTVLAEHCFYLEGELQEVQAELARAQEEVPGPQLRALWVQSYSYAGTHASQQPAYTLLQHIVSNCGKLSFLPAASSSSSAKQEATAVLAAAPGAATAEAAAPAAAAGAAGEVAAEAPAPASAAVNRVLTRAAAAAGLVSSQRKDLQQHSPAVGPAAAAAAAAVAAPLGEHGSFRSGAGNAHASSSRGSALVAAASLDADQGAVLATPQRPAAVSAGHMVPPMGPLPDFAAMAGALDAAATTPAATTSAAGATAAGHAEGHSGQQLPSTGGSSRRCATRELPPRRAVAVSRYGMLACRGSNGTPARGTLLLGAPDGPSSSGRAGGASHVGVAAAAKHQRTGAGSSSGLSLILPGTAAAAATTTGTGVPPGLLADGAGPSTFRAALAGAPAGPPAGSMTPASPKHAAAGTRGLAALFAGVGHGGAGSSQAGVGSNTGRLLSGLPSLQNKPNPGDSADLQRLSDEPSWLWPAQQHAAGSYGSHGGKAGPSSSNAQQHNSSVPVLRSARRAAAAAAGGGGGPSHQDLLQKMHERQGMHTRSSSGGGSSDGSNSHWHPMPGSAAWSSQHHPMHD